MPFDQSTITRINPPRKTRGELHLSWESMSPAGTWFQVYRDHRLACRTRARSCVLPAPSADSRFDVGAVAAGEADTDFSGSLPAAPSRRARLTWEGGTFLDASGRGDVAGFRVFASATAGGPVDATRWADVPAYTAAPTDGYGMGGYSAGLYGRANAYYIWESGPLTSGVWTFEVRAYDAAGNLGASVTTQAPIAAPPRSPGAGQSGTRLSIQARGYGASGYSAGGYGQSVAALTWLPSPG